MDGAGAARGDEWGIAPLIARLPAAAADEWDAAAGTQHAAPMKTTADAAGSYDML